MINDEGPHAHESSLRVAASIGSVSVRAPSCTTGRRRTSEIRRRSMAATLMLQPLVLERVADIGDAPEPVEDESGDRLVLALGHLEPVWSTTSSGWRVPGTHPLACLPGSGESGRHRIVLVVDLPHDLLQDVLEGDDARGAAVLVDDDRQVGVGVAQVDEQIGEGPALRASPAPAASGRPPEWSPVRRARRCAPNARGRRRRCRRGPR